MTEHVAELLSVPMIRSGLALAWEESKPGADGGHEEGGFIVRDSAGRFNLLRWPVGSQDKIVLPPHQDYEVDGHDIIASFHTHPNTGPDYQQEPSETDKRSVRNDPNLRGSTYLGEFVISDRHVYFLYPDGQVEVIGDRLKLLAIK